MKNRKLVRFLAGALVVIWGAIAYQVIIAIHSDNEEENNSTSLLEKDKRPEQSLYRYDENVRDPFRFVPEVKRDTIHKSIKHAIPPVWNAPPYRLTGILTNESKRTALLEGNDGSVSFLKEGDTLAGVRILKIGDKEVIYSWQKRKATWNLQ
jgi:hypothetical protein